MLGLTEAGQVRIDGGDDRATVAEIDLNLAKVLALLEQMRRVGMAQGMDVRGLGDGAALEGQTEGALERGAHWFVAVLAPRPVPPWPGRPGWR